MCPISGKLLQINIAQHRCDFLQVCFCIKASNESNESKSVTTFSPVTVQTPDTITMKAALTLCCLLVPAVLALKVTVEEEVRGEERAAAPGRGGNKFFWCQLYQPNCVDGCSSRHRRWMFIHCPVQFSLSRD